MNPESASLPPTTRKVTHVLIVDPQQMIRSILASFLQTWGCTTHTAINLIGACRAVVADGPFDVIVCNYDLPDGNAFNLVDWIGEQRLEVPTIVPYGDLPPLQEPQPHVTLLAKPFDPQELRETVERLARGETDGARSSAVRKKSTAGRSLSGAAGAAQTKA